MRPRITSKQAAGVKARFAPKTSIATKIKNFVVSKSGPKTSRFK